MPGHASRSGEADAFHGLPEAVVLPAVAERRHVPGGTGKTVLVRISPRVSHRREGPGRAERSWLVQKTHVLIICWAHHQAAWWARRWEIEDALGVPRGEYCSRKFAYQPMHFPGQDLALFRGVQEGCKDRPEGCVKF